MTVAKATKSPGQKMKTPNKGPQTPGQVKTPKGKGTPLGTPNQKTPMNQKTPKKFFSPNQASVNGTPKLKTPNANGTPKPKTPNTPMPKGNNAGNTPKPKTPKQGFTVGQKTPKGKGPGTPKAADTPGVPSPRISNSPNAKTPQGGKMPRTPKEAKARPTPVKAEKDLNQKRKRSASAAGLDKSNDSSIAFRALRVYNLPPGMSKDELSKKVRELMEPRGEIESIKHITEGKHIQVLFKKPEDARAAKKLTGYLLGGRHLTIVHHDDRDLPEDNRVVLYNVPVDLADEDVWSVFGSCGKILSIHMNRDWRTKKVQKCFVTFDSKKGADAAISSKKDVRGKQIIVKKASKDGKMFPIESTVYILNLSTDATESDVKKFITKAGPISGVSIAESRKRYAMVHMTNVADVEKALSFNGQLLNGKEVQMERHRKSPLYVTVKKENPKTTTAKQGVAAKKLKQNDGTAKVKVEEDDDEDDEEEDDVEGEEDDEEDDDEAEEEEDDDDEDMEDESEEDEDLIADFQGKLKQLKSGKSGIKTEDDEDDEDEDDDEDEEEDDEGDDDDEEEDDDDDEDDE